MSEQQKQSERDSVLATLEAEGVRFVNLEFTDVMGMAKCVTIPVEQFPDCLTHGKWFDGSAIEGFARIAERDMYLFPDLATFAILPGKVRPQAARTSQTSSRKLMKMLLLGSSVMYVRPIVNTLMATRVPLS